jgi:branched-chain amino acid transport system permease protein
MLQLCEFAANGLALGAVYALLALATTITCSTSDVLDLSTGAQATLSGIVAAIIGVRFGALAGVLAGLLSGAVVAFVFCCFHWRGHLKDSMPIVLSTFALLIIAESAILTAVGPEGLTLPAISGVIEFGGVIILTASVIAIVVSFVLLIAVSALLRWTPLGLNMRASAASPRSAGLVGIAVRQTQSFAFLVAGSLAGVAGVIACVLVGLSYSSPFNLTLAGLGGALLLGRKSPAAAFGGGMIVGLAETLGQAYLPSGWSAATSAIVILLVLAASRTSSLPFAGVRP